MIAVGFRFWSGEKFGQPPTWTDKATYVQIDATPSRVGWQVPAEVAIVGDPKLVLRQLIDAVKLRLNDFPPKKNATWLVEVATARETLGKMVRDRPAKVRETLPIHPDRLIGDLVSVVDRDATIVIDSFTLSGYISHWWTARFPGQIVDAGPLAPVGHGIGMAIGTSWPGPASKWSPSSATVGWASAVGTWKRRPNTASRWSPCCGTTARGAPASTRCQSSRAHGSFRHGAEHPLRPHLPRAWLSWGTRRDADEIAHRIPAARSHRASPRWSTSLATSGSAIPRWAATCWAQRRSDRW